MLCVNYISILESRCIDLCVCILYRILCNNLANVKRFPEFCDLP